MGFADYMPSFLFICFCLCFDCRLKARWSRHYGPTPSSVDKLYQVGSWTGICWIPSSARDQYVYWGSTSEKHRRPCYWALRVWGCLWQVSRLQSLSILGFLQGLCFWANYLHMMAISTSRQASWDQNLSNLHMFLAKWLSSRMLQVFQHNWEHASVWK